MASREQQGEFTVDPQDLNVPILNYPFPEVREKLGTLNLASEFYMGTLTEAKARELLHIGGYSFHGDLALPINGYGEIDFEAIHLSVIERITARNAPGLPGLSEFKYRYPTHGSTEAIRGMMAGWSASGEMTELGLIDGEYPGYAWDASMLGVKTHKVGSLADAGEPVDGRVWFVSNPSAVDGNWHDGEELQEFIARGHEVVLDYAYGGLTVDEHYMDVSAPNIKALVASPSKIFGVYYQRYANVAYARQEVNPLVGNGPWFRSLQALMDTLELYETFEPHELPRKHSDKQLVICDALGKLVGETMNIKPSDNIFMAHADEALPQWLPELVQVKCMAPRGSSTFRLTKLFARLEEYNLAQENNV